MTDIRQIKARIKSLIADSKYQRNMELLSTEIGKSPSYLRGFLSNASEPGAMVVLALSEKLGVSPNQLLGVNDKEAQIERASREISLGVSRLVGDSLNEHTGRDIMSWWNATGGHLTGSESFSDYVDIYEIPDSTEAHVCPLVLGAQSTASTQLGVNSAELLQKTIAPLGEGFARRILSAHESSLKNGAYSSIEGLDVEHPETGQRIHIKYVRTLAPIRLLTGEQAVLNFSELLEARVAY